MEFSHQLFNHTFINAAVKMAILGRDFLKSNDLVENYRCRYLTQTGTCLIIKSVDENPANNTNINNVSVQHKLASLLKDFPNWRSQLLQLLQIPPYSWCGTPYHYQPYEDGAQPRQAPLRHQEESGPEGVRRDVGCWYHLQVGRPSALGQKAAWRVAAMRRLLRPELENHS